MVCGMGAAFGQERYLLRYWPVDSNARAWSLSAPQSFPHAVARRSYVDGLKQKLQQQGYAGASIDEIKEDSLGMEIRLYLGRRWTLGEIRMTEAQRRQMEAAGIRTTKGKQVGWDWKEWEGMQSRWIDYLENQGYPFASLGLDSIVLLEKGQQDYQLQAALKLEPGPLYKLDSVQNLGSVKISNRFLHRYLGILPGSTYQREKLASISDRLRELPYLEESQPWSLQMLGTGAQVNLFLEPRKASQVNVLVGLLPSNAQLESNGLLLTGEANLVLRNTLGAGELLLLNWQQIQVRSPRLQFQYEQPFIGGSAFGALAHFNLLKKDSLWLNIELQLGTQYAFTARQTGSIYFRRFSSNLLSVDTAQIRATRKLPDQLDMTLTSIGVEAAHQHTNYRFNPRRGYSYELSALAGTRVIRENNVITSLKDPGFDYNRLYDTVNLKSYQFKLKGSIAGYWPFGKASVVKTALQSGWIQSSQLYRNELFQVGGFKLLRGFDEESIFASLFVCPTLEYRYLIGRNSFFFSFIDGGYIQDRSLGSNRTATYVGAGLGMQLETKAGLINLSLAAGKQEDLPVNLRQAKLHIGFLSYF